jgi:type IV secretory pathway VirD2 relaxase
MNADDFDSLIGTALGTRRRKNNTPGASKANRTGSQRRASLQKAARVAKRTPEVLVRISGGARGGAHVREHLNYITRNGKLVAENQDGELVDGRGAVRELASTWRHGDSGVWQKNSKDTVNLVLSMPPGTDRDRLKDAVRDFAARTFAADREYVFVRHDDTKHPHCHLTLKAVGHDGRRLNPRKADLQAWREGFAQALREHGVAAEASPRRARGVTQKAKRQVVLHAEQRKASMVARKRVDEAARRLAGKDATARPWEAAIKSTQAAVRNAWAKAADIVEAAGIEGGGELAADMRRLVEGMPAVQTQQQALEAQMRAHLAKQRGRSQAEPDQER